MRGKQAKTIRRGAKGITHPDSMRTSYVMVSPQKFDGLFWTRWTGLLDTAGEKIYNKNGQIQLEPGCARAFYKILKKAYLNDSRR